MRDTRAKIISAAAKVAAQRGAQNLTMDAVALEAGVSKGGVFYHFDSKDDLLLAMVGALVEVTDREIASVQEQDKHPGSWLRGFIRASLAQEPTTRASVKQLSIAFLTAAANDTKLLQPMNERQPDWRHSINNSGIDPVTAQIVRLATDGLWINDVMGVPVLSDEERAAVIQRLEKLTTIQATDEGDQHDD